MDWRVPAQQTLSFWGTLRARPIYPVAVKGVTSSTFTMQLPSQDGNLHDRDASRSFHCHPGSA